MAHKKQLLFVHGSNDLYGASRILIQVLSILQATSLYQLHIILPYKGPLDAVLKEKGVTVSYKNLGVLRKKYISFFGLLNRGFKIISAVLFIKRYCKKNKITMVYTNTSVILSAAIAAKISGITHYTHVHEIPNDGLYAKGIGRFISWTSTKIIVVSDAVKKHWEKYVPAAKIDRIYNGLAHPPTANNANAGAKKNELIITAVGRIIPSKGHAYLVEVARVVNQQLPNARFWIVGDTFRGYEYYEKEVRQKVIDYGLQEVVLFKGFQSNIEAILAETTVFFHPATTPDPFPTVLLEAVAAKVPLVCTNLGGAIEITNYGKAGVLVPEDEAQKAAELLLDFISNEAKQKQNVINATAHFNDICNYAAFEANIIQFFTTT